MTDNKPSITRRKALQGSAIAVSSMYGIERLTKTVAAQSGGPSDEISGIVENDSGPVENATVVAVPHNESLNQLVTTTDQNGEYMFDDLTLHEGENLYHVIARNGTEQTPIRGEQNYPFIAAEGNATPNIVVSRPNDNNNTPNSSKQGVRINSTVEWPSIGAEISNNTSGVTTAYIHRVSDGQLMGQTDISGLSSGDTFTVDDVNLSANTEYNFVADAGGSDMTSGFLDSSDSNFPYESSDGDLSIINGAEGESSTNDAAIMFVRIGGVGF